jgi:hypothetical protein
MIWLDSSHPEAARWLVLLLQWPPSSPYLRWQLWDVSSCSAAAGEEEETEKRKKNKREGNKRGAMRSNGTTDIIRQTNMIQ